MLLSTTLAFAASPQSTVKLVNVSNDPYTNSSSQHKTEVEPDNFSFGSTIVNAFQVGRFSTGGSSNIGWATSTNKGKTWKNGFLPGTTVYATPPGTFARISDPTVAYDAKHHTWLISALDLLNTSNSVSVSQSTDGGLTWQNPIIVAKEGPSQFFDKDWAVCDNTTSSPHYGNCYVEWDDANNGDSVLMSTSSDGGVTWGTPIHPANANGLGGQPLVQPNGTVIVPFAADAGTISSFTSTTGGTSWNAAVTVASEMTANDPGNMRAPALPSAEIDGAGKVFVTWADCRFESSCSANDIVMSSSTNGTTWSAVFRIPADPVGSGVDHLIPGIGVDKSTSGATAHLALTFYYFPVSNCTGNACNLEVGFVNSTDGGATWTSTLHLAGPMKTTWLANAGGRMVGDYISTSFAGGKAFPIFAVATKPTGSGHFNEAMYSVVHGLSVVAGVNAASSSGVVYRGHGSFVAHGTAQ